MCDGFHLFYLVHKKPGKAVRLGLRQVHYFLVKFNQYNAIIYRDVIAYAGVQFRFLLPQIVHCS